MIGRCLEAAVYGRIKNEAIVVEDEAEKLAKLVEILDNESNPCLILCNELSSAILIENFLKKICFPVVAIHEGIGSLTASRSDIQRA